MIFSREIWMIHVVEEIKLLLLLGNRMVMTSWLATVGQTYPRQHIRDIVRYLVAWNIKQFNVAYFPTLDTFFIIYLINNQNLQLFYKLMCYLRANKPNNDRMGTLPPKEPPEIHFRSIVRRLFNRL
jgi:hypothetical protein